MPTERFLVFVSPPMSSHPAARLPPPDGATLQLWRARRRGALAPGPSRLHAAAWSVFHALGVFRNRAFGAVLYLRDGRLVHRTMVFPAYYAFPFMQPQDIQAGDIWTDPAHRGRGLAQCALAELRYAWHQPGRRVWYVTSETNLASVRLAEGAGLVRAGMATHHDPPLGPRGFGRYELQPDTELSTV